MASKTGDGYLWTPEDGVTAGGLECAGVVEPPSNVQNCAKPYDVVVIGAGYAGLTAVRDLTLQGFNVLLLEARDRIGGRTYTVKKNGFLYEMGGTWVTHHMGFLHREMVRYGLDRDLIETGSPDMHKGYQTINVQGVPPRRTTHEEAGKMLSHAWDVFVNVDGQLGRTLCPLPHAQLHNPIVDRAKVEEWDQLSCQDRYEQIKHKLTAEEQGYLVSILLHISGGHMETSSLWDMIRSHALLMHSSDNFGDVWLRYKLRAGQSALARKMFDEAQDAGLSYIFKAAVESITQITGPSGGFVTVGTVDGQSYRARKVITTIPLNVLKTITFSPPLSIKKREAISIEHINHMNKIHADVANPELERWNGMRYPAALMYGYADGVLPNGNVHLTAFGADERPNFIPEETPEKAVVAFEALHPMTVKSMTWHNWSTDPYSQGGPAWWRPGYMSKYQDELQARHGDVLFASADWAHGWRAAIDGAMEQGALNAVTAAREVKMLRSQARSKF